MQKITYQVYDQFRNWLLNTMQTTSSYMVRRTTVNLTPNEVFEALVPEEHWHILRQASELLRKIHHQSFMVQLHSNSINIPVNTDVHIRINYSMPTHEMIIPFRLNKVREGSKLLEYLTPSIFIAAEWATLHYVTQELIKLTNDRNMLANLFPWLPDVVRESGWIMIPDEDAKTVSYEKLEARKKWYKNEIGLTAKVDRYACDRTILAALKRKSPAIAMTSSVREATMLGSKLFTQYRLAKQNEIIKSTNKDRQSTITPIITNDLVDPSIIKGLDNIKLIYEHEKLKNRW